SVAVEKHVLEALDAKAAGLRGTFAEAMGAGADEHAAALDLARTENDAIRGVKGSLRGARARDEGNGQRGPEGGFQEIAALHADATSSTPEINSKPALSGHELAKIPGDVAVVKRLAD